jgi:hypothetical protein
MGERIAFEGAVALAIRQVLQERRHRVALGVLRQPEARGKARAVPERNQRVLDLADAAGELCDDHAPTSMQVYRRLGDGSACATV